MSAIVPVILCGGSGTRLWPLSRPDYPKQFLDMGGPSLFQQTVTRALAIPGATSPLVVCNESQRFLAASALQAINARAELLLEHEGRNTAPAIALAAMAALASPPPGEKDPLLLVLPSDHHIQPVDAFVRAVAEAALCAGADGGKLVTFGVTPDKPETGFGYIVPGAGLAHGFAIAAFEEKPRRERAEELLRAGCFWNSGMFLFRASLYLSELARLAPDLHQGAANLWASRERDMDFTRFRADLFAACPAESIDRAVMEHTERAAVVPLRAAWSDLGSWSALYDTAPKDDDGNVLTGDALAEQTTGSYLYSSGRLLAALGLKDTIVVETPDAVLVADAGYSQHVKNIIGRLKSARRREAENHLKVFRPWGSYETIGLSDRFQVKRIEVLPGASLSLQLHHHRAEHWVIVRGTAKILRGDEEILLSEDESTYIPVGVQHRLENPGRIPLVMIEIQTGSYLGEDDIVRLSDIYGRQTAQ